MKAQFITVQDTRIAITDDDYISITDIARKFDPDDTATIIKNWLRSKSTVNFLGTWEILNNPSFKLVEFDQFKRRTGDNTFILNPTKWVKDTGAIGMRTKAGRYGGGTLAHKDIALAFCFWLSPEFQLYIIKEFQQLKALQNPEWNVRRSLTKVNYHLQVDAIKKHIIPAMRGKHNASAVIALAEEADLINLAVFGVTAAQWRTENADFVAQGMNIRDTADICQLLVLANMESYNETLIHYQMSKEERFYELEKAANRQLETLYKMNQLPIHLLESPNLLPASGVARE